ncbi:MAG TPA: FimV/HubP family polar landmark protein, partial [Rhodocyclaceae bacterium]|nr:FimV/HubP family polar landmark protein [Rhodocyclaceae bacterium]
PTPSAPTPAPETVPAAAAAEPKPPAATPQEYNVISGDTLSSIANTVKSDDVTQEQMLAALYQANSAAFIGGNINRLRTGRILKVPQSDEVQNISKSDAHRIVLKASNFESYRKSVASAAAAGPAKEPLAGQSSSGKIAPKVEEKVPANTASKDQLKISKTQVGKAGESAADRTSAGRIQALEEDIASRDKALKEANSRAADLEKNVKELQKLVDLKNQNLADMQKQAAAAAAATKEASKKADDLAAQQKEKAKADKAAADKAAADKAAADKAAAALAAKPEPVVPAASVSAPVATATAPAIEASAPAEVPVAKTEETASTPVEAPKPVVKEVIAPAPVEEQGDVLTNPWTLGGILVALIGVGLVVLRIRKRQPKPSGMTTAALSEASTSPNSVFGNAGGQTVDTGTSVLHTDFSQSGMSAIDTDEGVDPVAEADVYMAYGRDAQAEEILLDALKNDPTRTAVYAKLLEIYSQRRSIKQFENIATDLYTQTGGAGDDWAKAAALGIRLDPNNPLYRGNEGAAQSGAPAPAVAAAPAQSARQEAPVYAEPAAEPAAVSFGTNNVSQMRATWTVPGEINQFTGSGNEAPELPQTSAPAAAESLNLDFNLDLEMPEGEEADTEVDLPKNFVAPTVPLAPQPPAPVAAKAPAPAAVSKPVSVASAPAPQFDRNKEAEISQGTALKGATGDHGMTTTVPEGVAAYAAAHGASAGDDVGIERAMQQTSLAEVDLEKTNFEGNLLDFDFELGDEPGKSGGAHDRSLDLSNVNLRTDGRAATHTGGVVQPLRPASVSARSVEDDEPIGNVDVDDEVSTKLDLARAYEEMGDFEGARELLEEVVSDGAMQQKEVARTILARIA